MWSSHTPSAPARSQPVAGREQTSDPPQVTRYGGLAVAGDHRVSLLMGQPHAGAGVAFHQLSRFATKSSLMYHSGITNHGNMRLALRGKWHSETSKGRDSRRRRRKRVANPGVGGGAGSRPGNGGRAGARRKVVHISIGLLTPPPPPCTHPVAAAYNSDTAEQVKTDSFYLDLPNESGRLTHARPRAALYYGLDDVRG